MAANNKSCFKDFINNISNNQDSYYSFNECKAYIDFFMPSHEAKECINLLRSINISFVRKSLDVKRIKILIDKIDKRIQNEENNITVSNGTINLVNSLKSSMTSNNKTSAEVKIIVPKNALRSKENYKNLFEYMCQFSNSKNVGFYHFAEKDNALNIVRTEKIYSREEVLKYRNLIYDNDIKNEVSNNAMKHNKSKLLGKYVRFHINPKNSNTYSFLEKFHKDNTYGVIFQLDFSIIYLYKGSHILLSPISAQRLDEKFFMWNKYDLANPQNIPAIFKEQEFNLQKTYEKFKGKEEGIDCFQRAELLVYKEVPLCFVSQIYFGSEKHMKDFLSKLSLEQKQKVINRCEINKELFFGGDDR